MNYTISKNNLDKQIGFWLRKYRIFIPQPRNGDYIWEEIHTPYVDLKPFPTVLPPKKIFLPQEEVLFYWQEDNLRAPQNLKPFILLGIPSYDLQALAILDKIMEKDFYYQKRCQQSFLIGLGQTTPAIGYDIFLQEKDDKYTVTIGTQKGRSLIKPGLYQISDELVIKPESAIADPLFINPEKLSKAIKASIGDKIWDRLAVICLGCGICSYVCPLCFCFSLKDEIDLDDKFCPNSCQLCSGQRQRLGDSCLLASFSEIAGGYNFRSRLRDRIYNWYHHKFVRFPQEYGTVGCVSCGRCIKYCPARINYRKVLEEILVKFG